MAIPALGDEAIDETPESPIVTVMRINSAIGPITVREIKNGIERSENMGAEAFVIELNTPGGNMESTWRPMCRLLYMFIRTEGGRPLRVFT